MKRIENVKFEMIQGLVESLVLTQLHTNLKGLPKSHQRAALQNLCSTEEEVRVVDYVLENNS